MDLGRIQSQDAARLLHRSLAPKERVAGSDKQARMLPAFHTGVLPLNKVLLISGMPLKLDKTMIRCIGPGGSDWMNAAWRHWNLMERILTRSSLRSSADWFGIANSSKLGIIDIHGYKLS